MVGAMTDGHIVLNESDEGLLEHLTVYDTGMALIGTQVCQQLGVDY